MHKAMSNTEKEEIQKKNGKKKVLKIRIMKMTTYSKGMQR